jgi:hypothetical protein
LTLYQYFLKGLKRKSILGDVAAAKFSTETIFLRNFARTYVREIAFSPQAERELGALPGIGLADVLYVLRKGRVIMSEKEEADGAHWSVSGKTCEEKNLLLSLQVWCDRYRICVLRIRMMGANDV